MAEREIPKSEWGPGPWQDEPDRLEWTHAGLPCLAVRSRYGNWCGYAAVPPSHPLHGQPDDVPDVDVHGGLTYAASCFGEICHEPAPGEPDNVWWFGFDCHHWQDYAPGMVALMRTIMAPTKASELEILHGGETYRTLDYVRGEVERLADWLAAASVAAPPK